MEKYEIDYKNDDVMLPGFRFHPTDEELVGFYLKRKIQQRPLPIELIKQVDIYKYDPWDLPSIQTEKGKLFQCAELVSSGEKEWYFYCQRDRKYRNSARPNRVTGAGFWKATGTDRPIYSSDGTKCIGLKKSLVFYRGRAAKGIKTDWMMHEFRLPSLGEPSPPKKFLDKNLPPNDAWAICRIFKKNNSMTQKALSHSWVSPPIGDASPSDIIFSNQFSSEHISCTTEIGSVFQLNSVNDHLQQQQPSSASFSASDLPPSYRPINSTLYKPTLSIPNGREDLSRNSMFSTVEISTPTKSTSMLNPALIGDVDETSESIDFEGSQQHFNAFPISLSQDGTQNNFGLAEDDMHLRKVSNPIPENSQWGIIRSLGFPFSLPSEIPDAWKPNLPWDSQPSPSEISITYSTNKCYT